MPAILGMFGAEAKSSARDRITIITGSVTYETSSLPGNSSSAVLLSLDGGTPVIRIPWYDDVNVTKFEPSGAQAWYHFRFKSSVNSSSNDGARLGLGRNGTEYISISFEDSTNKLTVRVAGTLRATATSAAISSNVWARIHVHIGGVTAGSVINVYMDGLLSTPVLSYTLIAADATNLSGIGKPNEFYFAGKPGAGDKIDDLVAWDPLDAGFVGTSFIGEVSIKPKVFNADGSLSDWSGSYADIDELPASDTDKITAAAVGDASSFTKTAIAEDNVYAVKVLARVTRTGTDAGSNITIGVDDGVDNQSATMAAPADGDVWHIFQTGPDLNPWSPASFDASEIVFTAAT